MRMAIDMSNSIHGGGATIRCIYEEIVDDQIQGATEGSPGASKTSVWMACVRDWAPIFTSSWIELKFHIVSAAEPVSSHTSAYPDVMLP